MVDVSPSENFMKKMKMSQGKEHASHHLGKKKKKHGKAGLKAFGKKMQEPDDEEEEEEEEEEE